MINWLKENWFQASIIFIGLLIAIALLSIADNRNDISDTSEQNKSNPLDISSDSIKRFYLKSVANVRECAGLDCKIIGQYPQNTSFDLTYDKIDNFPEWVLISWAQPNNPYDSSGSGYINKILFSDTSTVVNQNQNQQQKSSLTIIEEDPPKQDLISIIKQWRSVVAYIECEWKFVNSDGSIDYDRSRVLSGSGLAAGNSNGGDGVAVYTNKHVITLDDYVRVSDQRIGMAPGRCSIQFPDNPNIYNIYNTQTDADSPFLLSHTYDFGVIMVTNKNLNLDALSNIRDIAACNYRAPLGENIVILGYPGIGTANDITATEGIISGYDGDYYITSAKIEHGNSGGTAISVKNNCALGIPTFVRVGGIESLGRILDINKVFNY